MTVLEHVRFSRPIGPGTQGKRRFSLGELPQKQRRAWDMWTDAAIAVHGSLDGARVIGEIKDLFARRELGFLHEVRR